MMPRRSRQHCLSNETSIFEEGFELGGDKTIFYHPPIKADNLLGNAVLIDVQVTNYFAFILGKRIEHIPPRHKNLSSNLFH